MSQHDDARRASRREALRGALGGAAGLALARCTPQPSAHRSPTTPAPPEAPRAMSTPTPSPAPAHDPRSPEAPSARMPAVYVPHGGGPWPFVEQPFGAPHELAALTAYLRSLAHLPPRRPRAVLMISAHWEEPVPTVSTAARPPMLYDYYGFPPEAYAVTWPAPGDPALAARVRALLEAAGIASAEDPQRGFDHGTFVPLKLTYPEADVPTVQLSLVRGLDPRAHLALGRALAPLRDEGVFVVGSGMSYHNMRGLMTGSGRDDAEQFDRWLGETMRAPAEERDRRLEQWASAPAARRCHPREEHLLPLLVIAGAAGSARFERPYNDALMGLRLSAFHAA